MIPPRSPFPAPTPSGGRLGIATLAIETAVALFANLGGVARAGVLPLLAHYGLWRGINLFWEEPLSAVLFLLHPVVAAVYLVAVCRTVLRADPTVGRVLSPSFGRRERRTIVATLLIVIPAAIFLEMTISGLGLVTPSGGLVVSLPQLLFLLGAVVIIGVVQLRLSLALPDIATDAPHRIFTSLRTAWARGRRAGAALFFTTLAIGFVMFVLAGLLTPLFEMIGLFTFDPEATTKELLAEPAWALLNAVLSTVSTALMAAMLSTAFAKLSGRAPADPGDTLDEEA